MRKDFPTTENVITERALHQMKKTLNGASSQRKLKRSYNLSPRTNGKYALYSFTNNKGEIRRAWPYESNKVVFARMQGILEGILLANGL